MIMIMIMIIIIISGGRLGAPQNLAVLSALVCCLY